MKALGVIFMFIFCGLSLHSLAQQDIRVYTEADNFKKGYKLMAEKNKPGTYTCTITFNQLLGYDCSEGNNSFSTSISLMGHSQIGSLTQIQNATNFMLNYGYTYSRGKSLSKVDSLYPYLLPKTAGSSIRTSGTYFIGDLFGKNNNEFYAMGFQYALGDTICATRAGIICEANDDAETRKENELFNTKTRNNIFLEHADGTLARYNILSSIHLLVQVGDKVIPGQPLAVFNKAEKDYTMLYDVFYLNLKSKSASGNNYFTVKPRFVFESDHVDLASVHSLYSNILHPSELITKELSNREIKKLGLKH